MTKKSRADRWYSPYVRHRVYEVTNIRFDPTDSAVITNIMSEIAYPFIEVLGLDSPGAAEEDELAHKYITLRSDTKRGDGTLTLVLDFRPGDVPTERPTATATYDGPSDDPSLANTYLVLLDFLDESSRTQDTTDGPSRSAVW